MKTFKMATSANETRCGALLCGAPCVTAFEGDLDLVFRYPGSDCPYKGN